MRIILVHNRYQSHSPSGEDIVYDNERHLLAKYGHDIINYEEHNDNIKEFPAYKKLALSWQTVWSRESYRNIRRRIQDTKPDVAHFHNTFPLISPSAYYACQDEDIPVVQTFHNYRFFCAEGNFFRNGLVCEKCMGQRMWFGIWNGCYRNSKILTIPMTAMIAFHRRKKTLVNKVDVFIALTEFARRKYIQLGLPAERIVVKPNFMDPFPQKLNQNKGYAIFLGRLTPEKGVKTLLSAWKAIPDLPLKIIGDGAKRHELEDFVKKEKLSNVEFLGFLSHNEAMQWLENANFLVLPSLVYESFPLAIREAFAYGKPVIASRLGAMSAIIEDGKTGLLFEPGNSDDLAAKIRWMMEHEDISIQMGMNARAEFEAKYTAEKNYEMLMGIYEMAIKIHNDRKFKRKQ